jgi:hypothetical protein
MQKGAEMNRRLRKITLRLVSTPSKDIFIKRRLIGMPSRVSFLNP